MPNDNARPNWAARIAVLAIVPVLAGGLWLFNKTAGYAEPLDARASGCAGFEAAAQKLFEQGDTGTLSGTFAPGERVHLTIDFKGAGTWESTGVLGLAESKVNSLGAAPVIFTTSRSFKRSFGGLINLLRDPPASNASGGTVNGAARLDLEINVTAAGAGTITINKTESRPSSSPPTVATATCSAAKGAASPASS